MSWGLFILAAVITLVVQAAVLPLFAPPWLDLLLVLALVCGLGLPSLDARLAGWFSGLATDLGSTGPLGLHAIALGLAVLALTYLRELVNRELWWVRTLIAFMVAWPAQLFIRLHERFFQGATTGWETIVFGSLLTAAVSAALAAALMGMPSMMTRRRRRRTLSYR